MIKMTEVSKPISDTTILCLCLLVTDLTALIFKLALFLIVESYYNTEPNRDVSYLVKEVNRMRYVIMSVEMLFICIPVKHNFVPHRLEI